MMTLLPNRQEAERRGSAMLNTGERRNTLSLMMTNVLAADK